jgi:hypothetical protein
MQLEGVNSRNASALLMESHACLLGEAVGCGSVDSAIAARYVLLVRGLCPTRSDFGYESNPLERDVHFRQSRSSAAQQCRLADVG